MFIYDVTEISKHYDEKSKEFTSTNVDEEIDGFCEELEKEYNVTQVQYLGISNKLVVLVLWRPMLSAERNMYDEINAELRKQRTGLITPLPNKLNIS